MNTFEDIFHIEKKRKMNHFWLLRFLDRPWNRQRALKVFFIFSIFCIFLLILLNFMFRYWENAELRSRKLRACTNQTRKIIVFKATTVQFNFVAFDDLVPYLPRFRQTFPNVENFEFVETDIRTLNQVRPRVYSIFKSSRKSLTMVAPYKTS